jgi:hypothetical protein
VSEFCVEVQFDELAKNFIFYLQSNALCVVAPVRFFRGSDSTNILNMKSKMKTFKVITKSFINKAHIEKKNQEHKLTPSLRKFQDFESAKFSKKLKKIIIHLIKCPIKPFFEITLNILDCIKTTHQLPAFTYNYSFIVKNINEFINVNNKN